MFEILLCTGVCCKPWQLVPQSPSYLNVGTGCGPTFDRTPLCASSLRPIVSCSKREFTHWCSCLIPAAKLPLVLCHKTSWLCLVDEVLLVPFLPKVCRDNFFQSRSQNNVGGVNLSSNTYSLGSSETAATLFFICGFSFSCPSRRVGSVGASGSNWVAEIGSSWPAENVS